MAIELKVILEDKPGALARLCTVLGDADVNIDAINVTSGQGASLVRFVTDNEARARAALEAAGMTHSEREVITVQVLDEPGVLRDVALVMYEAHINIDTAYVTTKGHVILGVDDLPGAIQVAGGMAVMAKQ